jgi:cytochrome c-type biogenesis protein CcmE
MNWLPKSPKARRRLWVVAAVAPVLALAVGLSLYAMRDSVTFFFSPSEATAETAPAGRVVRLGGLVEAGSVVRGTNGEVAFAITDNAATTRIVYQGDLPDRSFRATQVLAKHDENYMPREVADRLKAKGEWRPGGETPTAGAADL